MPQANQKKYLVSGIPTVSLNCRSVGRRTMTRPRPSFLRRYSLNWRCKKKGVAATSHLKTTPPFFLFFFAFFEKKWVGRDTGNKIFLLVGLSHLAQFVRNFTQTTPILEWTHPFWEATPILTLSLHFVKNQPAGSVKQQINLVWPHLHAFSLGCNGHMHGYGYGIGCC